MCESLSYRYHSQAYAIPDILRMRRPLEEKVLGALGEGKHAIIRGFPSIGKSTLMYAVLSKARSSGRTIHFSVKDVKSSEDLEQLIEKKIECLTTSMGITVRVDPENPVAAFQWLGKDVFIAIDDIDSLSSLEREHIVGALRKLQNTPKNVHLIISSRMNSAMDALLDKELGSAFQSFVVPQLGESETDYLVRQTARWHNIGYSADAVERISEVSGNRPWETFVACYLVTAVLEQYNYLDSFSLVSREQVEDIVNLQFLQDDAVGRTMLERYAYLLENGVSAPERRVLDKLTSGTTFDKNDSPAAERLREYAVISGMAINGAMLQDVLKERAGIV